MNIYKTKEFIKQLIGIPITLKVNLGRNKEEIYPGIIIKMYENIFTVKVNESIKSFSYSDVLTKAVKIKKI